MGKIKFVTKKKTYFEIEDEKYRVSYTNTNYGHSWIHVERKLFWFIYIEASINCTPERVKEFIEKVNIAINELEN